MRYVDDVLSGKIEEDEIWNYIEKWEHTDKSKELWEFLGFTKTQYNAFFISNQTVKEVLETDYSISF